MNRLQPYEIRIAAELQNLQLPDIEFAWKDMERRLGKPRRRRGAWWIFFAGLILAGGLLLSIMQWNLFPARKNGHLSQPRTEKDAGVLDSSKTATEETGNRSRNQTGNPRSLDTNKPTGEEDSSASTRNIANGNVPLSIKENQEDFNKISFSSAATKSNKKSGGAVEASRLQEPATGRKDDLNVKTRNARSKGKPSFISKEPNEITGEDIQDKEMPVTGIIQTRSASFSLRPDWSNEQVELFPQENSPRGFPSLIADPRLPVIVDTANRKAVKTINPPPRLEFSAGLALQQQIPIAGQKAVPYAASGRRGSLSDYIPSVYARMTYKKFFIQSGFRYGAPQYNKEFNFAEKVEYDSSIFVMTQKSFALKKSFYHQLPLTIHYQPQKNLSVGVGLVWNKFVSALAEVNARETGPQSDTTFTTMERVTNDSVFRNSYLQIAAEGEYRWKKLSFGFRYSTGLQPYIRFQLPGGTVQEEKNSSLQVFIRYELWKSKRK